MVFATKPNNRVVLTEEEAKRVLAIKPKEGQREAILRQASKLKVVSGGVKR